jgi:hypothetical protein
VAGSVRFSLRWGGFGTVPVGFGAVFGLSDASGVVSCSFGAISVDSRHIWRNTVLH